MKTYSVLSGGRKVSSANALLAEARAAPCLRKTGQAPAFGHCQVAGLKKAAEKVRESKDLLQPVFDTWYKKVVETGIPPGTELFSIMMASTTGFAFRLPVE